MTSPNASCRTLALAALMLGLLVVSCQGHQEVGGPHEPIGPEHAASEQAAAPQPAVAPIGGAEAADPIADAALADVEPTSETSAAAASAGATPTSAAKAGASTAGAAPQLNAAFKSDDLDVASFVERFEGESREIAVARDDLVKALSLRPGEELADVGAGTGLFLDPFHHAVGPDGHVYAVDISPKFLEHMAQRIHDEGLDRVSTVLCDDRSTQLRSSSVDVVFICDTYHHFEYPADTMASVHAALRAGGRVLIVDFERIPGVSREWLLDHVRCDKQTVIDEVEAAGFRLDAELDVPALTENYVLRFVKE